MVEFDFVLISFTDDVPTSCTTASMVHTFFDDAKVIVLGDCGVSVVQIFADVCTNIHSIFNTSDGTATCSQFNARRLSLISLSGATCRNNENSI